MLAGARIRFYHPDDYTQAKALEARVQPYRPGDEAAVEAMFERARRAKEFGAGGPRSVLRNLTQNLWNMLQRRTWHIG